MGFTTAPRERKGHFTTIRTLDEDSMNLPFRAVGEATEEAILQSMLHAEADVKLNGERVPSLREYLDQQG